MSDSRIDKLTAHYVKENSHPYADGYPSEAEDLRVEAGWHIADLEAAGLVVIDPDNSAMRRDLIATTAKFFQPHEGKTMHDSYWLGTQAVNVILGALRDAR